MTKVLIFSDFDFTMWTHGNLEQIERNKRAVQEFRKRGGKFALATGRGLVSLMREFPDYREYLDYLVDFDGAITYVVTPEAEEEIMRVNIPPREVEKVEAIVRRTKGAFRRDVIFFRGEEERQRVSTRALWQARKHNGIVKIRIWCEDGDDCRELADILETRGFNTFSYYDLPKEYNMDIGRLHWVGERAAHGVEVLPRGLNKGTAIAMLWETYFRDYKIVTAGDDINDVTMLELFNGYAISPTSGLAKNLPTVKLASTLEEVLGKIMD